MTKQLSVRAAGRSSALGIIATHMDEFDPSEYGENKKESLFFEGEVDGLNELAKKQTQAIYTRIASEFRLGGHGSMIYAQIQAKLLKLFNPVDEEEITRKWFKTQKKSIRVNFGDQVVLNDSRKMAGIDVTITGTLVKKVKYTLGYRRTSYKYNMILAIEKLVVVYAKARRAAVRLVNDKRREAQLALLQAQRELNRWEGLQITDRGV